MSPCGAKIDCAEMISSESISCLFYRFSYWVPIIQERLRHILKKKHTPAQTFKNVHTGKQGEGLYYFAASSLLNITLTWINWISLWCDLQTWCIERCLQSHSHHCL
jgi:hypothetical protein